MKFNTHIYTYANHHVHTFVSASVICAKQYIFIKYLETAGYKIKIYTETHTRTNAIKPISHTYIEKSVKIVNVNKPIEISFI